MYLNPALGNNSGVAAGGVPEDTALDMVLQELHLFDIWRLRFPREQHYCFFPASYASLTRIDLAIGNQSLIPRVQKVEYLSKGLSDTPLLLT